LKQILESSKKDQLFLIKIHAVKQVDIPNINNKKKFLTLYFLKKSIIIVKKNELFLSKSQKSTGLNPVKVSHFQLFKV